MPTRSFEQELIARQPKVLLEVKDSSSLPVGRTYQITPTGTRESTRQVGDSKTVIGSDKNACDIVLERDTDVGNIHCAVEFNSTDSLFYLKDLGDGNGTFIKIEDNQVLHNGDVVNFGASHARIDIQESNTGTTIAFQFYEGPLAEQEFIFRSDQQPIKIGRVKTCSLAIDDPKMSINHCVVNFNSLSGWTITDGDGSKRSANGTW